MQLQFVVTQQHIVRADKCYPVSDSREYLFAHFDCRGEDWQAATTRVMIVTRAGAYAANVTLDAEGMAQIPAAYLASPSKGNSFMLGLALVGYGANGLVITTEPVGVEIRASNYTQAGPPAELPPDLAQQIYAELASLRKYVEGISPGAGVTYLPHVSEDGVLSWTNDGGRENPEPVRIRGDPGAPGTVYTPSVSADGVLSWQNDGGLENPAPVNIKGERGEPGDGANIVRVGDDVILQMWNQYYN